jgi:ribosomal protein S8
MVKMSVINDALKNIVNAEKAGKRQVCETFLQPLSLPVEEML